MFQSSLEILFMLLVAAILGFLIAWFLRRTKEEDTELRALYEGNLTDYNHLKTKYQSSEQKIISLQEELKNKVVHSEEEQRLRLKINQCEQNAQGLELSLDKKDALIAELERKVDVLSAYKLQYEKALEQMEENDKLVAGIRSDYSRLKSESEKYNHNLELHLAEKQRLKTDFLRVSNDLKSLNQSYDALSNTKKDLSQQIDTLQAEIRKLKQTASNAIANNNTGDLEKEITNLKSDLAKKEKELQRLGGEKILLQAQQEQLAMGGLFTHKVLEDDLQKKEKEVDSLGGEKILLQAKMEQLTMGGLFTHQVLEYDIEKKQHKEEPAANKEDEIIQRIKAKAANINFERIGKVDASQKDDLQRVKGIGPFIERKLNALGIYKFVQIARFTEEDEEKVNEAIEFFAGRVKRDEWAKQAAVFAKEKGEI